MDVQLVEIPAADPVNLARLVARPQLPAGRTCAKADGELLTNLAVGVGDDVLGIGVDTDDLSGLDVDPGLFLDLADDGLADVLRSAGDGVQVVVSAPDHQQPAELILDERAHRYDDVGCLRGVRVVVVVGAGHSTAPQNVARLADAQTVSRLSE